MVAEPLLPYRGVRHCSGGCFKPFAVGSQHPLMEAAAAGGFVIPVDLHDYTHRDGEPRGRRWS